MRTNARFPSALAKLRSTAGVLLAGGAAAGLYLLEGGIGRLNAQASGPALVDGNLRVSAAVSFGTRFGIVTEIQTGPNGSLFLVSLADGVIYEISRRK
jgi:hypothetical protein